MSTPSSSSSSAVAATPTHVQCTCRTCGVPGHLAKKCNADIDANGKVLRSHSKLTGKAPAARGQKRKATFWSSESEEEVDRDQLSGKDATAGATEAAACESYSANHRCDATPHTLVLTNKSKYGRSARLRCVCCQVLTPHMCDECVVHLCLDVRGNENCFKRYHTMPGTTYKRKKT